MPKTVDYTIGGPGFIPPLPYPKSPPGIAESSLEDRIKRFGSPYFPVNVGAIAASAEKEYSLETSADLASTFQYSPLDMIHLINNDPCDLLLTVGEDEQIYCPAGSVTKLTARPYRRFKLRNLSTTTAVTSGNVRLVLRRELQ